MPKGKKFEIGMNANTVAGVLSIFLLLTEFYGLAILISSGQGYGGLVDFILIFGYAYIIYKVFIKKSPLEKWEGVAAIIIIGIGVVIFALGFILGVIYGYLRQTPVT